MNLPTIPHDKSLHMNYGAIIAALSAMILLCIFVPLRPQLVWLVLPSALLTCVTAALIKEELDDRANRKALAAGLKPAHGVERADITYTVAGGCLPLAPIALLLLLVM